MLDYRCWIDRAVKYINRMPPLQGGFQISGAVQPPLDAAAVDHVAKRCRLPIPDSLRRFWMTAASGADLCYQWEAVPQEFEHQVRMASDDDCGEGLWGGLEILSADEVVIYSRDVESWAEEMSLEYPKDARLWRHSLPIVPGRNGDCVALYVRDDLTDPPVVYLAHEASGGSFVLAPNLDAFLKGWETLCFICIDFLVTYCDPDSGLLAVENRPAKLEALQALLHGETRTDLALPPPIASEQDWLTACTPNRMLEWLEQQGMRNERKLRLYCCACCQRVNDQMGSSGRYAVDVSLRYADGLATDEELAAAHLALSGSAERTGSPDFSKETIQEFVRFSKREGLMHRAAYAAVGAYWWVSSDIAQHLDDPERAAEEAAHADLVRHVFGNPFRSSSKRADYQPAIRGLAQRLSNGEAVSPLLRAALLDAGESELAEHFRSGDHPRGCWALDQLLGK